MSNLNKQTPSGDDVTQRSDMKPAFSNDLFERALSRNNLSTAWKRVRANKGAAGVDGITTEDFLAWANSGNWIKVTSALAAEHYKPSPVRRVEIDKPDGGKRQLGIPTVTDRIIQQAIAQVLTPIFDPLDKELEKREHKFARYADDFTILVKSQRAGERVLKSISRYLQHRLKLTINASKSRVVKTSQSQFLGFTFKSGRIQPSPKSLLKFKQEIRRLTNRNWGVSMKDQLFKTSQFIRGWINYFGIANCYQLCVDLDHWIRRRVRMAYWRQWRKPRTKVRNLMRLGVRVQAAVACGITSKGPWRSSKTPGINQAISNDYLKSQGLYALRDGWIKLHHSK